MLRHFGSCGTVELFDLIEDLQRDAPLFSATGAATVDAGESFALYADRELVALALSNLVANACKYNDREPRIEVSCVEDGGVHQLRVQDNGRGIPPDQQEAIFEKFHRGREQGSGFGLGLALVARIAELHGGKIRIEDSSSTGTTFLLELPGGP